MRPPQNAGESGTSSRGIRPVHSGFNEAPAERGGKFEVASEPTGRRKALQ